MDAALFDRLNALVPVLARRTLERLVAEVPAGTALPRELAEHELDKVRGLVEDDLRLYLRMLAEERMPTFLELSSVMDAAARRAQERIALADTLTMHHVGLRLAWEEIVARLSPIDQVDVARWAGHLLRYVQVVTSSVSTAYVEAQETIHSAEHEARRALLAALLAGRPAAAYAERAGLRLASSYLVVVLALGGADASGPAGRPIGLLRQSRGVQEEFDRYAGTPVLCAADVRLGTALVPVSADALPEPRAGLDSLAERLASVVGAPVMLGAADAIGLHAIPAAAAQARDVAWLALGLGRPPGAYQLADVLLEYQLTRPGAGRDQLASLLDRLDGHPHLLETLLAYQRSGHNRRQAAATLHVHPNTLDYRLSRVATLTNLDPGRPAHAQLLAAAVIARTPLPTST
ncbi:PucR family transcriptional regulator [Actinopolymorpha pittospori]